MFGFIDASLDLTDLFGNRYLFGADFRALPQGLATPCPILLVQQSTPFIGGPIPRIEKIPKSPDQSSRSDIGLRLSVLIDLA
jgi:hypothetical protein